MEIKEINKVKKYHPYIINEFVKEHNKVKKESEVAIGDIDKEIEELLARNQEILSTDSYIDNAQAKELEKEYQEAEEKINGLKEQKRQINEYLEGFEEEKQRILEQLNLKVAGYEEKIKENEKKKNEVESELDESKKRLAELEGKTEELSEEEKKEKGELEKSVKNNEKKISRLTGVLTRYDNKINEIREIQSNLGIWKEVEGLKPPRTIQRARTKIKRKNREPEIKPEEQGDGEAAEPVEEQGEGQSVVEPTGARTGKGQPVTQPTGARPGNGQPAVQPEARTGEGQPVTQPTGARPGNGEPAAQQGARPGNGEPAVQPTDNEKLIKNIEIDVFKDQMQYEYKGKDSDKVRVDILNGLKYDKNFRDEVMKRLSITNYPKEVMDKIDYNILDLILKVGGTPESIKTQCKQYMDTLAGKAKNGFGITYNLKDIYKSDLSYEDTIKIIEMADSAKKSGKGIVKVKKDNILKRFFGNIGKRISSRKALNSGNEENGSSGRAEEEQGKKFRKRVRVRERGKGDRRRSEGAPNRERDDKGIEK